MAKNENKSRSVSAAEPYALPEGWKWTRLGDVADFIGGGTPDKSNPNYWNGIIPWASVKDIKGNFLFSTEDSITETGLKESAANLCDENGLILVTRIAPGKAIISKIKTAINQDLKIVKTDENKLFLKCFFDFYEDKIKNLSSGTTVKGLKLDVLEKIPFPLPPTLAEQKRIVSRIESMFTKLDEARDKAQSVVDGFETRKAAILHKAFTGQLRIDNEELKIEDWEEKKLEDVLIEKPRNGYSTTAVDHETPYKTMSLSATTSGYFRPEFYKYIEADISDDSFLWLKPGDILIQRANSLDKVGTSAIYTGDEHEFIYPDLMMKLQVKESVSTTFIAYQLKTEKSMVYFRNNATGTAGNMPKINQKTVCNLPIKLPPLNYQLSIVNFLDTVLEKESRAKEAAQSVLEQIALLKKSILARAFRGEL